MNSQAIVTFDSTHDALTAQKTLKDAGRSFRVIPTPVEISSNCGIALLVTSETAAYCTHLRGASCTVAVFHGNRLEILGPCVD